MLFLGGLQASLCLGLAFIGGPLLYSWTGTKQLHSLGFFPARVTFLCLAIYNLIILFAFLCSNQLPQGMIGVQVRVCQPVEVIMYHWSCMAGTVVIALVALLWLLTVPPEAYALHQQIKMAP